MDLISITIVILYLMATAFLGYQGYKQTHTAADYLVAGRKTHPIVMALSYGATFISTSAIVGFGGVAANFGMGLLWLTFFNIFVGIFVAFVFFGGRTRRMGHHLSAHTFPELLGKRFNSRFLHVFSALVIFFFMPLYAMAVIKGGSEFIASIFDVQPQLALYIFALIVAAYVIPGGMKGVMLTDALQGLIMLVGMIYLLMSTYFSLGGIVDAHQTLTDLGDQVPKSLAAIGHQGWTSMPHFGWSPIGDAATHQFDMWWIMVSTIVMGVGIGVLAQPQLIVRFMTVQSQQALNRAVPMGGFFIFFMTGVAFLVGAMSNVYFAKDEVIQCRILSENVLMDPGADGAGKLVLVDEKAPDEIKARSKSFVSYRLPGENDDQLPHYVMKTPAMQISKGENGSSDTIKPGLISVARTIDTHTTLKGNVDKIIPLYVGSALPKWFGVVFLLTLLAAAMSTLSSQFHTIGTAIGRDIYEQVTGQTGKSVLITRFGVGIGLIAAIILGTFLGDNIIAIATAVFFGLCAAAFLPAYIGGLFWKRMSPTAAIASMVSGFVVSTFWSTFVNAKTATGIGLCKALFGAPCLSSPNWSVTWNVVDPLFIALPVSALVAVLVGLLTRPMSKEYSDYCFGGPEPKR